MENFVEFSKIDTSAVYRKGGRGISVTKAHTQAWVMLLSAINQLQKVSTHIKNSIIDEKEINTGYPGIYTSNIAPMLSKITLVLYNELRPPSIS